MAEIVEFPKVGARFWNEIEPTLRTQLLLLGGPPGFADWICEDLRPRILATPGSYNVSLPVAPADVDHVHQKITELVHGCTGPLLQQLLLMELELYFALHGGAKPPPAMRGDQIGATVLQFVTAAKSEDDPRPPRAGHQEDDPKPPLLEPPL
jgi:hypothetical protein